MAYSIDRIKYTCPIVDDLAEEYASTFINSEYKLTHEQEIEIQNLFYEMAEQFKSKVTGPFREALDEAVDEIDELTKLHERFEGEVRDYENTINVLQNQIDEHEKWISHLESQVEYYQSIK